MTELTKEQSEKADYLLEIVCNSDSALGSSVVYDLFDSKEDAIYVFSILKKLNLISIISETENDPLYLFGFNENTCHFLKQGGFLKKYINKDIKQVNHPIAKEKRQNAIVSFIVKFWWAFIVPLAATIIGFMIDKGILNIGF